MTMERRQGIQKGKYIPWRDVPTLWGAIVCLIVIFEVAFWVVLEQRKVIDYQMKDLDIAVTVVEGLNADPDPNLEFCCYNGHSFKLKEQIARMKQNIAKHNE